jgi:hypothetical protein
MISLFISVAQFARAGDERSIFSFSDQQPSHKHKP